MSAENDLAFAYHMGYDDALAKRKPDASKTQVLAPYALKAENEKLRELCETLHRLADESYVPFEDVNPWMDDFAKATCAMRELGIEVRE